MRNVCVYVCIMCTSVTRYMLNDFLVIYSFLEKEIDIKNITTCTAVLVLCTGGVHTYIIVNTNFFGTLQEFKKFDCKTEFHI